MLREAAAGDSPALGRIYCHSWKEAYKGIVPAPFLDALTPESRAPSPNRISSKNNLVYEENGALLGLVNFGANRDEQPEQVGEIRSIYVLPEAWGKGIGSALFRAAEEALAGMGYEGFYLWVLRDNNGARRFYERMGMEPAGEERTITIAEKELPEMKYVYRFRTAYSEST